MFKSIYTTIVANIQKSFRKGSGWIIDSVHTTSLSKYNPLVGRNYIKLIKELDYPWPWHSIFTQPDMLHIFFKIEGQFKKND